jgi:hypothetical protein
MYIISLIDRFIEELFMIYCRTIAALINIMVIILIATPGVVCSYIILWLMGIVLYLVSDSEQDDDNNIIWVPVVYGCIMFILIIPCLVCSVHAT